MNIGCSALASLDKQSKLIILRKLHHAIAYPKGGISNRDQITEPDVRIASALEMLFRCIVKLVGDGLDVSLATILGRIPELR